jgi:uncharacterized protein YjeT (DUF2065 family)
MPTTIAPWGDIFSESRGGGGWLTLVGWCLLIKGLIRFCAPKQALRMMARVSLERSWEFQVAGAGLVAIASLLSYGVYAG